MGGQWVLSQVGNYKFFAHCRVYFQFHLDVHNTILKCNHSVLMNIVK